MNGSASLGLRWAQRSSAIFWLEVAVRYAGKKKGKEIHTISETRQIPSFHQPKLALLPAQNDVPLLQNQSLEKKTILWNYRNNYAPLGDPRGGLRAGWVVTARTVRMIIIYNVCSEEEQRRLYVRAVYEVRTSACKRQNNRWYRSVCMSDRELWTTDMLYSTCTYKCWSMIQDNTL